MQARIDRPTCRFCTPLGVYRKSLSHTIHAFLEITLPPRPHPPHSHHRSRTKSPRRTSSNLVRKSYQVHLLSCCTLYKAIGHIPFFSIDSNRCHHNNPLFTPISHLSNVMKCLQCVLKHHIVSHR